MHRAILLLVAITGVCISSRPVLAQSQRNALPSETVELAIPQESMRAANGDVLVGPLRAFPGATTPSTPSSNVPGDTSSFYIPRILSGGWDQAQFTLVAASDTVRLWVGIDEWTSGFVSQRAVDSLMVTIHARTPARSFDPEAGIFEISRTVFGETSNIGGDGVVDILWYDIFDDYSVPGTVFTPVAVALDDIDPNAPTGAGNQRDMIYLDTFPSLTADDGSIDPEDIEFVRGTLAGGFQALIHMNHDTDETAFFRIGLFEWAKDLSGFAGPSTSYLHIPRSHRLQLVGFNGFFVDRERSGHFMRYAADQLGIEAVGSLAKDSASGVAGIKNMLAASSDPRAMSEFVADFHVANFVNDTTLAREYGYGDPRYADVSATAEAQLDGSLNISLPPGGVPIGAGGVYYVSFDNVRNLEVRADALDPVNRVDFRAFAVIEAVDGTRLVEPLLVSSTLQLIPGANERVTIVLAHSNLEEPSATGLVTGEWAGTAFPTINVVRDDGEYFDAAAPNFIQLGHGWTQAVRFEPPAGMALRKVFVPPIYKNQFIDPNTGTLFGTERDPRDFRIVVLSEAAPGVPGDTLLVKDIEDPRPYALRTSRDVEFLSVEMDEDPTLALGESTIYVGLTESGADANTLILGLTTYAASDVSLIYGPLGGPPASWSDLWGLTSAGETLEGYSVPIRGQFRSSIPVDVEQVGHASSELTLVSVYPNPANRFANVTYRVGRAGTYSATVLDILGRRLRHVDATASSAGDATLVVDTSTLASGVYFVALSRAQDRGAAVATKALVVAH